MSDSDPMQPLSDSRERAAFHVSIHSATAEGRVLWETRAYHEESDTAITWPGPPGEALVQWLRAIAGLPQDEAHPQGAPEPGAADVLAAEPAESGALEPVGQGPGAPEPAPEPLPEPEPVVPEVEPADDFTQIIGISAATERQLHAAGIRTYAQLAERTPAELGRLLGVPPERITRRGWITRARALARLATLPSTQPAPEEAAPPPAQPGPTLWVEVLFDDEGAILEQRLLREGEPPAPQPGHDEARVARFFVAAAPRPGGPDASPIEVVCELDDLELDEIPSAHPGETPRLRARSTLRVEGLGAAQARREGATYMTYILAHDLATGATAVLHGTAARLEPDADEDPIALECELPEIGRYQMLLVALLADGVALSAAAGPRLRVNP